MKPLRHYSLLDQFCLQMDQALRTLTGEVKTTERPYPASAILEDDLSKSDAKLSGALMRINHTGEICAQALYHAQALVSKREDIKKSMQRAAIEEGDHLMWCQTRLIELGSHQSYLNPFWYAGSFVLGVSAGLMGDQWNLGFLAETEQQVAAHLEKHLITLPKNDHKSQAILKTMHQDESEHRDEAIEAGAVTLPARVKKIMQFASNIMVKTTYWI